MLAFLRAARNMTTAFFHVFADVGTSNSYSFQLEHLKIHFAYFTTLCMQMVTKIRIAAKTEFLPTELAEMYRLRAKVFYEHKRWDVQVTDSMEIDQYDHDDSYYLIMRDEHNAVSGCWRLLSTEGEYMLKDTFPSLLSGQHAPCAPNIWELSRFIVQAETPTQGFGFSELVLQSIYAVLRHAQDKGIDFYVTVTTTAVERMLRSANVSIERIGPPLRIGSCKAVALWINVDRSLHTQTRPSLHALPLKIGHQRRM
ncbi:acyl-homoserine-lactone synthase [Chromobacterium sp. IIBBL 290-4]|uniref:acyl-homoserine-lactone synthase n=1 Tax=Chromobacterium sp. IIBBL 290-4 TaxID=2953890 RepID=UPI0020B8069B|nr:acyl-homoserine-lactone synthase [Chromobacterium sp. IIBBL 290-4]UTH76460.1 GNAT family N-acetyltransferase [Chromobacterium sp. IIBBL 290-4]